MSRLFATLALLAAIVFIPACATAPRPESIGNYKLLNVSLIWLREPSSDTDRQQIIKAAHRFSREIPEVQRISVGPPFPYGGPGLDSSFDICLVMQFEDEDALDRFTKHPVVQKTHKELFLPLTKKIKTYNVVSE